MITPCSMTLSSLVIAWFVEITSELFILVGNCTDSCGQTTPEITSASPPPYLTLFHRLPISGKSPGFGNSRFMRMEASELLGALKASDNPLHLFPAVEIIFEFCRVFCHVLVFNLTCSQTLYTQMQISPPNLPDSLRSRYRRKIIFA